MFKIQCPLCGEVRNALLFVATESTKSEADELFLCTSSSYGVHNPIYKCDTCGLAFIVDQMTETEIVKHYQGVADPEYVAQEAGRIKTFRRHLKNLQTFFGSGNLLDIGAYTGLFVHLAHQAGWQAKGIEPGSWPGKEAVRKYGVKLHQGPLRRGYFQPNSFDVVTMWDVVEHFVDPKGAVAICYAYLKSGGWIAMSTIDISSWVAKVMGSRWPWLMQMHRVYFSHSTMTQLLTTVGFRNIRYLPHIRYISLGYLWNRFIPVKLPQRLEKLIIPWYIGDLFDVYAQK